MPQKSCCSRLAEARNPLLGDVAIRHGSHIGILKNDGRFTCLEAEDSERPLIEENEEDLCYRYHGDPNVACCDETRVHLHVHSKIDCADADKRDSYKLIQSDVQCDLLPVGDTFPAGCAELPGDDPCLAWCAGDKLNLRTVWHGDHYDRLVPNAKDGTLELHYYHEADDGTAHCDYHGKIFLQNDDNKCGLLHLTETLLNKDSLEECECPSTELDAPRCRQKWPHSFGMYSLSLPHDTKSIDMLLGRVEPQTVEARTVRTVLIVEGICCPSEIPLIRKILEPMKGVHEVQVNVMAKKVIVRHDGFLTPQVHIVSALNAARLGARIDHQSDSAPLSTKYPPLLVILSGILWFISLLHYIGNISSIKEPHKSNFKALTYVGIAACVVGYPPIGLKAFGSIRNFVLDVNVLMSLAIISACIVGEYPEAGAVTFLFSLGEWLETRATERTRIALTSITNMRPDEAETLKGERIPVDNINIGDILVVRIGTKVPVDGFVVRGDAQFDESQITGESLPASKAVDDTVYAGSLSVAGFVEIQATCRAEDSSVAKVTQLVEEAAASRSPTERSVDRFAKYYTPIMVVAALLYGTIPYAFLSRSEAVAYSKRAVQLLVISCPCALVISTPVTYISALVTCAHNSVLVKGGKSLEVFSALRFLLLDKTGTLTESRFDVKDFSILSTTVEKDRIFQLVRAVENCANHPLADCVVRYVDDRLGTQCAIAEKEVRDFQAVPGEGVMGTVLGDTVTIGNIRLVERMKWDVDRYAESGTQVWVGVNGVLVASVVLDDTIRQEAPEVIRQLHELNVRTVMLTGDNRKQATSVGTKVGIAEVESELLPQDKINHVKSRKHVAGRKKVGMVGDGINDAAALAAADVGVAMGAAGTSLAIETADVILLDSNLSRLPFLIKMGRSTVNTIWFNIIFSVSVKLILLVLLFTRLVTQLWVAIVADVGTMLLVTLNGNRLLRVKGFRVVYECQDTNKTRKKSAQNCCFPGRGWEKHSQKPKDDSRAKPSCADEPKEAKPSCADKPCCAKKAKPSGAGKPCCTKEAKSSGTEKPCCTKEAKSSGADKPCCTKEAKSSCADKPCCTKEAKSSGADKPCCTKEAKSSGADKPCCTKEAKSSGADKPCCTKEAKPSCADKPCCTKEAKSSGADKPCCTKEAKPSCADKPCCTKEAKPSCADKPCCTKEAKSSCADKPCCTKEAKSSCADKPCCTKEARSSNSDDPCCTDDGCADEPCTKEAHLRRHATDERPILV